MLIIFVTGISPCKAGWNDFYTIHYNCGNSLFTLKHITLKKTKDCFALTFFNINKEQIIAYGQFDLFPVLLDDEPFNNREWAGIVSYRLKDVISNLDLPGGVEEMHIHINDDEWKVGHFSNEGFTIWSGEPYEKILQEIKIRSLGYI